MQASSTLLLLLLPLLASLLAMPVLPVVVHQFHRCLFVLNQSTALGSRHADTCPPARPLFFISIASLALM